MTSRVAALRAQHPKLRYLSFEATETPNSIVVTHHFRLEPGISFSPRHEFPKLPGHPMPSLEALAPLFFHCGLVESISYWKAACPPQLSVECGTLHPDQLPFWQKLFTEGLGEFYYLNQIHPQHDAPLTITSSGVTRYTQPLSTQLTGSSILVAGGKDSSVVMELVTEASRKLPELTPSELTSINPIPSVERAAERSPWRVCTAIRRTVDPMLLTLNGQGYLNGHTPFSALVAALSITANVIRGRKYAFVGNERSASEGNTEFAGITINHQYSKSLEFERLFRAYSRKFLATEYEYVSLLRPLHEIQIAKLLSRYPQHLASFRSCNKHQKLDSWCLRCPKCVFVFLMIQPFLSAAQAQQAFGGDPLLLPENQQTILELTGLLPVKSFECVGTREESILGCHLYAQLCQETGLPLPEGVKSVVTTTTPRPAMLSDWSEEHCLPQRLADLIHTTVR